MKKAMDLVAEANSRVKSINAEEAKRRLEDSNTVFVDLRDGTELQRDGKIPGAMHVNRGMLEFVLDSSLPYHKPELTSGKQVVFYCAGGGRSALAADTAQNMGLSGAVHLAGGFKGWKEAGGEIEKV
jgi:rhodanese-related sulfurtransferase